MTHQNLEFMLERECKSNSVNVPKSPYKSHSEEIIANILDRHNIKYSYEKSTCVEDKQDKERLWYPDFYLKDHGILIEYIGRRKGEDEKNYSKRIEAKKEVYDKMGVKYMFIHPEDIWDIKEGKTRFKKDFENYFITKINEKITKGHNSKLIDANVKTGVFENYKYGSCVHN